MAGYIEKMAGKTVRLRHILERRPVIHEKPRTCMLYLRSEVNQNGAIFKRDRYLLEGFRNRIFL
jgi:hypothetical protein